jgi:FkbM family methyltransferase
VVTCAHFPHLLQPRTGYTPCDAQLMRLVKYLRSGAERSARSLLSGSRLFFPLRRVYQQAFRPEKWQFWKDMMSFYGPFFGAGDLVFDVGANVGTFSQIFLQMGAKVIAVEPNEDCHARLLELTRPASKRMFIEKVALGDRIGTAELHACDHTGLSTINDEWRGVASRSETYGSARWTAKRTVPLFTLDSLAEKYGVPRFIKIDVEGYEDRVLLGMSFLPGGISFEFHPSMLSVAANCLSLPTLAKNYAFNYTVGESSRPELASWVDATAMRGVVSGLKCEFGDILARRRE